MNQLEQINQFLGITGPAFVHRLNELQELMKTLPGEQQVEPPVNHYFAHNTYVREMHAPANSIIVGKTHRHDHICTVLKGRALVYSEFGSFEVEAPFTFTAQKGSKRLFVIIEDLIFQNIHATPLTDLDEIEHEFIVPDDQVQQFRREHGLEE